MTTITSNTSNTSNTSDSPSNNDSSENLEALIDLKFSLERQVSVMTETFKKAKDYRFLNLSSDRDIQSLFTVHNNNIKMSGQAFLDKQTTLVKEIDTILLNKCDHEWIHDVVDEPLTSRNICYCKKCYCRQY